MNSNHLKGLIAAPFTPMTDEGEISPGLIGRYADHLVASGVMGAFVCGTTGESPSLTTGERKTVLKEWVQCARGRLKVICHVGGNSLPQSIDLAAHAALAGADAIGAFAPSFFKPANAGELLAYLGPVAQAAPKLPFYYYHIPSMNGVQFPVHTLLKEVRNKIPNFAGVKYTHFDLYDMQQCLAFADGEFEVLHGYDEVLLAGITLGVKAAVGSTYNYMPSVYLDLWEAYNRSDMEKARAMQMVSVKMVEVLIKYGGGVRAGKAIMELIGINCGPCRLPIAPFSKAEKAEMLNDLRNAGLYNYLRH